MNIILSTDTGCLDHRTVVSSAEVFFHQNELDRAYAVLRRSGLILIKLDIGYGLVGRSDESIRRIYKLKGRSETNPCVVPGNMIVLRNLCPSVEPKLAEWIRAQVEWTPLSLIAGLDVENPLWLSLPDFTRHYCSRDGTVAVFLGAGDFMEALVERALADGQLLAGSSANLSGCGNCYRPEELPRSLIEGVDLFINHGVARYENPKRLATTMIDLRKLQITRRGANHVRLEAQLEQLRADI